MTPTVRFCVPRYRPASRGARRPLASSPSWRRIRTTTPQCMQRCLDAEHAAHYLERHRAAGGPLPGYAASHGCVRMPYRFAEKLFDKTRIGMRVIISPNDAAPVEISHASLFTLNADAIAAAPGACRDARPRGRGGHKGGRRGKESCRASGARDGIALGIAAQAEIAKDPRRRRTRVGRQGARRTQRRTKPRRGPRSGGRRPPPGSRKRGRSSTSHGRCKIESRYGRSRKGRREGGRDQEGCHRQGGDEAKLALEPASIFISRAKQKLYVRRNTHKRWPDGGEVFDATIEVPVTIRNPDKPIGTHVFTAMARNDAGLRWTAVTIDDGDEAKNALDRITIPQDVLDQSRNRLAALLDRRFDAPLSREPIIAPNLSRC